MKSIPISLQTYSVRDDMKTDFARTIAEIGKIGYTGVELAGHRDFDAAALKAAIDGAGLKVSALTLGYAEIHADLNAIVSEALHFGTKNVNCMWWPGTHYLSAAACQKIGEKLGEIGSALRPFGIQFSFHNHAREFQLVDGRPVFDWILSAAAPRDLKAEPDVYWIHKGGYSPAKFLREQGSRCPLIHIKDETELGLGPVNFAEVFAVVEEIGAVEWYVVEQEKYNHAPLHSVRLCFEQLKRWGKA
jgi:sugar phosphate isomerase/epimerase